MSSDQTDSSTPDVPVVAPPDAAVDKAVKKGVDKPEGKLTRAGALWAALILGFLILIVLLIFIAQNTETAAFTFLSWHWQLPLGVAIMAAAVAGGLVAVAVGAVRMFQLRRIAKRNAGR